MLIATRDRAEVERIADRVIEIVAGRPIIPDPPPATVEARPARRFRLRLDGPLPPATRAEAVLVRLVALRDDEAIVELAAEVPSEAAWRILLLLGWPIREVQEATQGSSVVEPRVGSTPEDER